MKKNLLPILLLALCLAPTAAQQNLQLVSHLDYVSLLSNIWGYTAPDGTEYALVGTRSGTSIVSLADPANPLEVALIPGGQSAWRELKTFGNFAYVTTDQPGTKDGILVIDLSQLPNAVPFQNWTPVLPGQTDTMHTCHTIFIDEFGYAYLSGCENIEGGVVMVDVFSEPGQPKFVGYASLEGTHDTYARNNLLYSAEILLGRVAVYDVSDKSNSVLLGTQNTPYNFTHNTWLSDDGNVVFTTDERANASTAAYDVSDPTDIRLLDEFRPAATLGTGVIPHNVHVLNDFLVIAHYTDGCVLVDASRPDNLVEVGHYDTNQDFSDGFHGAWGVFPYFPSGLIVVSDIENGLFVLQPDYRRAASLHGTVSDEVTGAPIPAATVEILSVELNSAKTNIGGNYKTGQVGTGTFEVKFSAKGYFDAIGSASLNEGEITVLDMQLKHLPLHALSGQVVERNFVTPIPGALVSIENKDFMHFDTTDADGKFSFPDVTEGVYTMAAAKWGYQYFFQPDKNIATSEQTIIDLAQGYQDHFYLDLGWTVSGTVPMAIGSGTWERGEPAGTFSGNVPYNPNDDSVQDPDHRCYATGNNGIATNDDDVDGGFTLLTSPPMQLRSRYNRPMLVYDTWFVNIDNALPADDSLTVLLDNGSQTVILEALTVNTEGWRLSPVFDLAALLPVTDEMRVHFRTADGATFHVVEAGVDFFQIFEGALAGFQPLGDAVTARLFPNPFRSSLTVDYKVEGDFSELKVLIFNALGQVVAERKLVSALGTVVFETPDWVSGVYLVAFEMDGKLSEAGRVVRH